MIDPDLKDMITRWESLGWFDRKRICWISFWSTRGVCPRLLATVLLALAVLGILLKEHHSPHRILLLSVVFLFYFYAIAIDYFYNHRRETV